MNQRPPLGDPGRRVPNRDGYNRRDGSDDFAGRSRSSDDMLAADGLNGLRSGVLLRWLGSMSTRTAMLVLVAATVVGVVLTLATHEDPGDLLGIFIVVGSLIAVLGVRRGAVYLFFPMPALAFFVGAVATGIVHDRQLASSTAGLATSLLQWIAGIFFPAVVATIVVLLVGGLRWVLKTPLISGQSSLTSPGSARPAPGTRRPAASGPWAAEDPFENPAVRPGKNGPATRPGSAPRPAPNGPRPPRDQRPPRNQRTDRDPWGDPRLPADRPQPQTGPRPQFPGRSASQPQPRAPRPQQGQSGPSWTPNPQRPPRPQPPDGWTQRLGAC